MRRMVPVFRIALTVTVLVVVATSLSACGRKGRPIAPDGATYDQTYPKS